MSKYVKLQIIWASLVFVLILIIGYLGIFALQKSMTIKMSYSMTPNIRCEIFIGEDRVFSNLTGDSCIDDNWFLYESTSTLKYLGNSAVDLGASYTMRIVNHTNTKVFAEISGTNASHSTTVMDATNGEDTLLVSTVSNDYEVNFYKVEDYYLTANLTGVQFDLTNYANNTLLKCGNNYYIPLGENLNGKLILNNYYVSLPETITATSGVAIGGLSYNNTTGIIEIENENIIGNILLSANATPQNFALNIPNFYENIIIEGDFETNTSNWHGGTAGTEEQDTAHVKSGNFSCKMVPCGGMNYWNYETYIENLKMKSANQGHVYYNSVWEYNEGINNANDGIEILAPIYIPANGGNQTIGYSLKYINKNGESKLGVAELWNKQSVIGTMGVVKNLIARFDYNVAVIGGTPYSTAPIWVDNLCVIDLTAKYGAGNEPTKAWCDANIDDWSLKTQIPYGTDYTANIVEVSPDADRTESGVPVRAKPASINVTIGGQTTTNGVQYTYNATTGYFTIYGEYITGAISITS